MRINKRGETAVDVIMVLFMLALWIVPPVIFAARGWYGGWWWFGWWVWLSLSLASIELASKQFTKRTISQHYWRWLAAVDENGNYRHLWQGILQLVLWTIGWGILIVHLFWPLFTGRKFKAEESE